MRTVVALPLLACVAVFGARPAHAALSCLDYLRGVQLGDTDVLDQAKTILAPLVATGWASMAMKNESVTIVASGETLLLRQIARDCAALPSETVDSIAAVHLRMAQKEAADRQAQQQAQSRWQHQETAEEAQVRRAIAAADPLRGPILPTPPAVGAITCGQYLGAENNHSLLEAFTTALQAMTDADPVARRAHVKWATARMYNGAFYYCQQHPTDTLKAALNSFVDLARSEAPHPEEEQAVISRLRAKPNKSAEEIGQLTDDDAGVHAGPRGGCRYFIAATRSYYARNPDQAKFDDMITARVKAELDWCTAHPGATEEQIKAAGLGGN